MMEIFKEFTFEAAHYLPHVSPEHKCRRLHGHSFHISIHVKGALVQKTGWVMDFSDIKQAFEPIHSQLDHYCLNDIDELDNPTSENIARWIWRRLKPSLPILSKIVVRETCSSGCIYEGED